jgi:OOP family OmpA-OmpF porin
LRLPASKLDEVADALRQDPSVTSVQITGYTDRIGPDGYNLKLSQRRAEAVKTYLAGKGIDSGRLSAVGKGKADPVVQCNDRNRAELIKCLEPNRRVVIEQITIERKVQ